MTSAETALVDAVLARDDALRFAGLGGLATYYDGSSIDPSHNNLAKAIEALRKSRLPQPALTATEFQGRLETLETRRHLELELLRHIVKQAKNPEEAAIKLQDYFDDQRNAWMSLVMAAQRTQVMKAMAP